MRGIGEPVWAGRSQAELDECYLHESLLNVAFADRPSFQLLCPYDTERAARTTCCSGRARAIRASTSTARPTPATTTTPS